MHSRLCTPSVGILEKHVRCHHALNLCNVNIVSTALRLTLSLVVSTTVVVHDGRILEKPVTEDEVKRNIAGYAVSAFQENLWRGRTGCSVLGGFETHERLIAYHLASLFDQVRVRYVFFTHKLRETEISCLTRTGIISKKFGTRQHHHANQMRLVDEAHDPIEKWCMRLQEISSPSLAIVSSCVDAGRLPTFCILSSPTSTRTILRRVGSPVSIGRMNCCKQAPRLCLLPTPHDMELSQDSHDTLRCPGRRCSWIREWHVLRS